MASSLTSIFLLVLASLASISISFSEAKPMIHIRVYLHAKVLAPNANIITVAKAQPNATLFSFGSISVLDERLTVGSDPASAHVGQLQGMVAQASMTGPPASIAAENIVFTAGEYNGSTLTVAGRVTPVTGFELTVVGGTGRFRLAGGYAIVKTLTMDTTKGTSVAQWDVYVLPH